MIDNTSKDAHFRPLRVFLCHDLRDKQETVCSDGRGEKGIVLQLTEWLEAQHCAVWRSDKELFGGVVWEPKIFEQAIPTCDLFVICLTENFVEKTDGERHHEVIAARRVALNKHPDPDNTFIIPVRIHHVQYPGFKDKQYVNYYKGGNFEGLKLTLERKRQQLGDSKYNSDQSTPRWNEFPDSRGSTGVWNVPHRRNPHFTGRDDLLDQLEQQLSPETPKNLTASRRSALTQPQAIKGLGGIGKTQIAVEYAYRCRDQSRYMHTFWVNAASEEAIITSFVTLAELLPAFPMKNETDQRKLMEAVKGWLEECKQRWLLVFDNADDLSIVQQYLPKHGKGDILLTTRTNAVGSLAASIEVETMGFLEGTHLLLRRAQRFDQASDEEINQAGNIVIALDHFPLALDQAGAFIEETQCSFVEYLQTYRTHGKDLLKKRGLQMTNYPESVATTWLLSFEKVEQTNPASAELLRLCAFLAPDMIPEELIREGAAYWTSPLQQATSDIFAFNQMIAELLKFSLIKRLTETQAFSLHRLVQTVQKDMMELDMQYQWAERVVRGVEKAFPPNPQDIAVWPQCLRYLDQAQACNALIEHYRLAFVEAGNILNLTGLYLYDHALYTIAEPLYQRSLSIYEQQLGNDDPATAQSLNNLAALFRVQGRYSEAEPLYQRSLSIIEQQLGIDDPITAIGFNNLAALYQAQGRYSEAEPLYQRALSIREQQLGTDDPVTAQSLNNLAALYQAQGRYSEAEPLYLRALLIYEQQLGNNHPSTAQNLCNLAELYQSQGRYSEAEPLYQRSLSIYEQQLGNDHPSTAIKLNSLARLYRAQGRYSEAEPLHQRALSIYEQQLGNHPDTALSLNSLALLYQAQGKYSEAEPLYLRALSIQEQLLGNHPDTATSLNNLALLYRAQGKYSEAEPLYQRALSIREQQLGNDHPDTVQSLNSLAVLYQVQGRYSEAEPLYQRALSIYEQQLGNHPDTALSLNNLATLYRVQGKYSEAEPLYQRALSIYEQQLGNDHPDTATSLNNLATLYQAQGRYSEAEPLYQRSLSIREQQLGTDHPSTAQSLNSLASLYRSQGRYNEAEPLFLCSLSIQEQQLGTDHPDTATSLNNLAILYQVQSRYSEAEPLYQRAISICEQQLGNDHPTTRILQKNYAVLIKEQMEHKEKRMH